jgi:transposase InsO family protein
VTARGASLTHDARGNTTNDGAKTYSYDGLNRLTSASNGAGAVYDPSSRLLSLAQARAGLADWRADYNTCRPHSALGNHTPQEFSDRFRLAQEVA